MARTKSRKQVKKKDRPIITLKHILNGIQNLPNADGSKIIWSNNIISLVATWKNEPSGLTYAETADKLEYVDVYPLLSNFDETVELIESKIVKKNDGNPIARETQKQHYIAILTIIGKSGILKLDDETSKSTVTKKQSSKRLHKKFAN
jgi:hypothetical protein